MFRIEREKLEEKILSPYAALSKNTLGRDILEEPCPIRTEFQRDRDRIIHSKAFRRLKQKTQVFIAPEGDHFRTRLTHTLEVSQIARTIARSLRLNEDLTEAIALGHDLGHTPFGHAGEEALDECYIHGFKHNEQSLRIVEVLEEGKGLNLTKEVRDGILNHTGQGIPSTLEGNIVRIADRIAYINHDIDDALRAGIIKQEDLPKSSLKVLGTEHGERINTMVIDIIKNSWNKDTIKMSPQIQDATNELRCFLFEKVYRNKNAQIQEKMVKHILKKLFNYYKKMPSKIPIPKAEENIDPEKYALDYIAGMTDRYALEIYKKIKDEDV